MTRWELQAPDEIKNYSIDWTSDFETGEEIETSEWVISPDLGIDTGAGLSGESFETTGLIAHVLVSGLSVGQTYQLKNTITTNNERTLSSEITIRCGNK